MKNDTKYWIGIDSWNLMESFVTESLSPYSFYLKRGFGNNLSRFISTGGETFDHLILTDFPTKAEYAIEVSSELLNIALLERQDKGSQGVFFYPKTIYYKKGLVRFRFDSNALMIGFIAESKILFEVKCLEKYKNDFYTDDSSVKSIRKKPITRFSFEQSKYVSFDTKFNFLKGAIIGYARGQMTSLNEAQQNLQVLVNNLKNSFAGLYTQLMMNQDPINDMTYIQKVLQCKKAYYNQGLEPTNLFDIFIQLFHELVNLSNLRSNELMRQKTPGYTKDLEELQLKKDKCHSLLLSIESEFSIIEIRKELESIKKQEVRNGKSQGKSRLYFGKDTPEYHRKQELKEIIKNFENDNKEYSRARKELVELEREIANYRLGYSEYDNTISALFIRLSDSINEILKKINLKNASGTVDLSKVKINNLAIEVSEEKCDTTEIEYFNLVLDYILSISKPKSRLISEVDILGIIEETSKAFSQKTYSNTEVGKAILETLRQYWNYKKNKTSSFVIPDNLTIFPSVMSFFIKPQGFDQIERFMLNRKFSRKEYAFMLWGAYIGFASVPKTFTSVLYNNELIDKSLEEYFELFIHAQ